MDWFATIFAAFFGGIFAIVSALAKAIGAIIVFLFANWIVQALFVAWVAFEIQQVNEARTRRIRSAEKRYDDAVTAIQRLCGLLNARLEASSEYLRALSSPSDWSEEREHYRNSVSAWKAEAQLLVIKLIAILPSRISYRFDREVFQLLVEIETHLRLIREAREADKSAYEEIKMAQIDIQSAVALSSEFLHEYMRLADRRREQLEGRPAIDVSQKDVLSIAYLCRSLFVRRYS